MQLSSPRAEHNPLYLLSAALVLTGCTLWSNSLSGVSGPVLAALLAEVYALCLIGGVALLTRIELRRPAILLALLALLYQWDLTFHTETAVFLGGIGDLTSAAWAALFVGKLYLLQRALRVRLAWHAWLAALVAAAGLVLGPRLLPLIGERAAGASLAGWLFALGVLAQRREETLLVASASEANRPLLRRLTIATWSIPGVLLAVHLLFLAKDHHLGLASVVAVAPLLHVRRVRDERAAWMIVATTLAVVALALPAALSVTALLAAFALLLRAFSPQLPAAAAPSTPLSGTVVVDPYRFGGGEPEAPPVAPVALPRVFPSIDTAERDRLVVGALFAIHLSAWTLGWTGGDWPAHRLVLDLLLSVAVLAAVARFRRVSRLLPLAVCWLDFAVRAHVVSLPRSGGQWGLMAVSLGFLLLGGSLATSYRRARRANCATE